MVVFEKTVVINLARKPERMQRISDRLNSLNIPFTRVEAVDGHSITQSFMSDNHYGCYPWWFGNHEPNLMNKGSIGCFLSHYDVWTQIAQQDRAWLILEDDAAFVDDFDSRLALVADEVKSIDWELLYLGSKQLNVPSISNPLTIESEYAYWTVGYILKPSAAKKLTSTDILDFIIPVDEYLPAMFGKHKSETLLSLFSDDNKINKALALKSDLIHPEQGAFKDSQIENSSEYTDNLVLLSVATDAEKASALITSCERFSLPLELLGLNQKWHGGDMTGAGGGQKIRLLKERLHTLDDNVIVLFIDGYDVVINSDAKQLLRHFSLFQHDVVFAAEKTCWPDKSLSPAYPDIGSAYKYLNSGCFMGLASTLKQIVSGSIADHEDDQLYYTKRFLAGKHSIALDSGCSLFQTVNYAKQDVQLAGRNFRNISTGTTPVVLHGNGGGAAKDFYSTIIKKLEQRYDTADYSDIYSYQIAVEPTNTWSRPAENILQLTFWTPEFCQLLIEVAETINRWESLPDDNHPGQELRLSKISPILLEHINSHFKWRVGSWLKSVWAPYNEKSIKDLFIIKYSCHGQRTLELHHDSALVSASVKLNDSYEGGELEFPRQAFSNRDVPMGEMIVWPSKLTHPHRSNELTSGTKYSATFWLE